jgi:hypothetical protein
MMTKREKMEAWFKWEDNVEFPCRYCGDGEWDCPNCPGKIRSACDKENGDKLDIKKVAAKWIKKHSAKDIIDCTDCQFQAGSLECSRCFRNPIYLKDNYKAINRDV